MTEWPSLGIIPLRDKSGYMPEALIINERGIVRITPDNGRSVQRGNIYHAAFV